MGATCSCDEDDVPLLVTSKVSQEHTMKDPNLLTEEDDSFVRANEEFIRQMKLAQHNKSRFNFVAIAEEPNNSSWEREETPLPPPVPERNQKHWSSSGELEPSDVPTSVAATAGTATTVPTGETGQGTRPSVEPIVVHEGPLLQFKPGHPVFQRWVQLTTTELKIFSTELAARELDGEPIFRFNAADLIKPMQIQEESRMQQFYKFVVGIADSKATRKGQPAQLQFQAAKKIVFGAENLATRRKWMGKLSNTIGKNKI